MPCGVESVERASGRSEGGKFLMCRVELKVMILLIVLGSASPVPNVPCGVERIDGIG